MIEEKRRLRESMTARRDALEEGKRESLSDRVALRLISMIAFDRAQDIMMYASFRSEVGTWRLIRRAVAGGKDVFLPRTNVKRRRLVPVRVELHGGCLAGLVRGPYGILEPAGPEVDACVLDMVCVPALAFDRLGYRLGYGGGFYDRFLEKIRPETVTVGLSYHTQLMDRAPRDDHDLPVDFVVTDEAVIASHRMRQVYRGDSA